MLVAASLLLALGLGSFGCAKKKKEDAGGAANAPAVVKAAPASDELRGMLSMVPVASEAVIGLDVAALRKSDLYASYKKDIESAAGAELAQIRTLCGFDPIDKVSKVVGGGTGNRRHGDGTIVVKGLSKSETMDCLTQAVATPPKGINVIVDGDYAKIERTEPDVHVPGTGPGTGRQGAKPIVPAADAGAAPAAAPGDAGAGIMPTVPTDSMSLEFLDDQTVIIARRSGAAVDKDAMQGIIHVDASSSVTGSQGFREMIDGIDTDAPVWFVVNGKTPGGQKLGGGFLKFDAEFGQVYVGADLDIDVTLRLESPDAATRMAAVIQRQVDSMRRSILKDALGAVTVESSDRDMHLRVKESRQQLEKLIEEVGDLLLMVIGG
jgi:hypothetical protein